MPSHLRGVARHEARGRAADETGDALHLLILLQHLAKRVGYLLRFLKALAFRQEDLYCKLIAVGIRELTLFEMWSDEQREQNYANASADSNPRMPEGIVEHMVIGVLYPMCNGIAVSTHLARFDEPNLEYRNNRNSEEERYQQVDAHRPREILNRIGELTLHGDEQREEDHADAERCEHHWHEILFG